MVFVSVFVQFAYVGKYLASIGVWNVRALRQGYWFGFLKTHIINVVELDQSEGVYHEKRLRAPSTIYRALLRK